MSRKEPHLLVLCDTEFCDMLGFDSRRVMGNSLDSLFPEATCLGVLRSMINECNESQVSDGRILLRCPAGSMNLNVQCAPVNGPFGSNEAVMITLMKLTACNVSKEMLSCFTESHFSRLIVSSKYPYSVRMANPMFAHEFGFCKGKVSNLVS